MLNHINLKNINYFDALFCFLIISIPFSKSVSNIILITLGIFFIVEYKHFNKLLFKKLFSKPFLILLILITFWIIKSVITNSLLDTKFTIFIPMFFIPMFYLKVKKQNYVYFSFLILGLITSLIAFYGLIKNFILTGYLLPFEGDEINKTLGMERPYLAFISLICIIISSKLKKKFPNYKFFYFGYILFNSILIYLISARISAISLILIGIIYLMFYIKLSFEVKVIYFFILMSLFSITLISNKNLRERLFITNNLEKSLFEFKLHEPRFIIWDCAYNISKSKEFNVFFGLKSERQLDELLSSWYDIKLSNKHRANYFISTHKNTHNQFIDIYLISGIIGLFYFIFYFIIQIKKMEKNFFNISTIISLLLFLIVENVLRRQMGVYIFGLLFSFINLSIVEPEEVNL